MNRYDAIQADNAALDQLGKLSRALRTINALIVYFRMSPRIVRELDNVKELLLDLRTTALARRAAAGERI